MDTSSPVSVDLLRAAHRSESFPKDWTPEQTERAIARYVRFLQLAAENPDRPVAPTREIDTIWHLHMLSPVAYQRDCMALFGKVLDHDGGFGVDPEELPRLVEAFEDTAQRWEAKYGEPYESPETGHATNCWHNCQSRCWHACKSKAS